ncbi:DEAD/DEAH box helicase family protein [Caenispirillum salinarum]
MNSPFRAPDRHWQLDKTGNPTEIINTGRRRSEYFVPIAQPKKVGQQGSLSLDDQDAEGGAFSANDLINEIRGHIERWRSLPPSQWGVTHETARLLDHWREGRMARRPFFCQVEAVETIIWLEEVAPKQGQFRRLREKIRLENEAANPGLFRLAAKMATGSGKTTVMAMLIAWQTVNAARGRRNFSDAFLIVAPGITIRDRLRILLPSDPENYYEKQDIVPDDMIGDIRKARIVITNYHAFGLRQTVTLPKFSKALLQGHGEAPQTQETEGQMLARVCPDLLKRKNVIVINDEAHHCYQEKPGKSAEEKVSQDEREETKRNAEAARLWINGIKALDTLVGVRSVYDLSATPFFLRGSGYPQGTLFPWVVSDFSLMDAIEAGIVKIPRVPISDNSLNKPMPVWRRVWPEIKDEMPLKGRAKQENLDPEALPEKLLGALHGLYEHYEGVFDNWSVVFGKAGSNMPPVFIVVCQNTSHSKLLYDYIAGYEREEKTAAGESRTAIVKGKFPLFSNYDEDGRRLPRPRTLLIDSNELDSGGAMTADFKKVAGPELELFKQDVAHRYGQGAATKLSDEDLLREVMNTVGKEGRLGESIRCVVSVSMLTEGWDTNTVTHILGVRAFGTPLLCEQVVGRGLRRVSYDPDENGMFRPEYANIFGIPFSFAQESSGPTTFVPPKPTRRVFSVPDRASLEITFPRVQGYRIKLPSDRLRWTWDKDSRFTLNPETAGPTRAEVADILGAGETITLDNYMNQRISTVAYHVAGHALRNRFRDQEGNLKPYLFPQLLRATREWLETQLTCTGGTKPGLFLWKGLADEAALRIYNACVRGGLGDSVDDEDWVARRALRLPIIDAYNPEGSTRTVDFQTSKDKLWTTKASLCPINLVVGDSDWELGFCETVESMPQVLAYAKNHGLGFDVPYAVAGGERRYRPDFIVRIDDGHGPDDALNLIVEIKGYRGIDAQNKKEAMDTHWVPAVNNHGGFGRWAFLEIGDVYRAKDMIETMLENRRQAA